MKRKTIRKTDNLHLGQQPKSCVSSQIVSFPPPPPFLVSVVYVYLSTDVSLALNVVLTFTQSVQIKNSTWEWVGAH